MSTASNSLTADLVEFLEKLQQRKISYHLQHTRPESILVSVAVPGERWEVEFLKDGQVEVERFISDGRITDEGSLTILFETHGSDDSSPNLTFI